MTAHIKKGIQKVRNVAVYALLWAMQSGVVFAVKDRVESETSSSKLINPLHTESIPDFFYKILDILLVFAQPLVIFYIMYAGYLFVLARGNGEQVSKAKNALFYALIGGVIVFGAKLLFEVIQGTVKAL